VGKKGGGKGTPGREEGFYWVMPGKLEPTRSHSPKENEGRRLSFTAREKKKKVHLMTPEETTCLLRPKEGEP